MELGRPLVSLLHHPVSLDTADATLLGLLDGDHSRPALAAALTKQSQGGYDLEAGLARLAARGLLIA